MVLSCRHVDPLPPVATHPLPVNLAEQCLSCSLHDGYLLAAPHRQHRPTVGCPRGRASSERFCIPQEKNDTVYHYRSSKLFSDVILFNKRIGISFRFLFQPLLVVTFDTGHCALSLHTLHAQLFLLSQAALRRELAEDSLFQRLLSKWFLNELGEMNQMEIITPRRGCSLESEILPDYLKPHLLRSGVPSIVNKGEGLLYVNTNRNGVDCKSWLPHSKTSLLSTRRILLFYMLLNFEISNLYDHWHLI